MSILIIAAVAGSLSFAGGLAWLGIESLRSPAPEPHVPDHVDVPYWNGDAS
jgi:hypothetical protein